MFGGGFFEIGFLLFIAFLLFGPKKVPEIARTLGKGLGELRRASNELKNSLEEEIKNLDRYPRAGPIQPPPMGTTIQNPPPKNPRPDPEEELTGKQMSFLEHLEELRVRLLHSIYSVLIGSGICFYFRDAIYAYLSKPLTDTLRSLHLPALLVYTNPVDPFNLYIKLAIMGGIFLASPYVLFQLWLFISPGLYRHEKKYIWPFVMLTSGLFISGGFFAYKLALPKAFRFLLEFAKQFQPMVTINEYWNLAITMVVAVGAGLRIARHHSVAVDLWNCHAQVSFEELSLCGPDHGGGGGGDCPHP